MILTSVPLVSVLTRLDQWFFPNNAHFIRPDGLKSFRGNWGSWQAAGLYQLRILLIMVHSFSLTSAARYVLVVLTVYTITWLPWVLTFFLDTALVITGKNHHIYQISFKPQQGYHEKEVERLCGNFSVAERDSLLMILQSGAGGASI